VRVIPDRTGKLHEDHPFFSDKLPTIIYSEVEGGVLPAHLQRVIIDFSKDPLLQILLDLADRNLSTLFVEGGAQLIQSFIRENLWQEAVVIRTPKKLGSGISAPLLHGKQLQQFYLKEDEILHIERDN
jgi:diaminohydroxyphosphoribosylaminopyrimidine deaminase/5-amino-6-(5-phosphoribosylamino)uracil reductase